MVGIDEYMQSYLKDVSAEEWEVFNCVKNVCNAYEKNRTEMVQGINEAIVQYKNEGYGPIEKLLDMIVGLAKLTTAPSDVRKLDLEGVAQKQDMMVLFQDLKNTVSDILDGYKSKAADQDTRIDMLVSELGEAKQKLSLCETEKESLDRSLVSDVQRLLAKLEIKELPDENHPINLMLEDLELEFTWDYEGNPGLFNKLIITTPELSGVRLPAMIRKEKLVRQGSVNIIEQDSTTTSSENNII